MFTAREMESLVNQINSRFQAQFDKIEALEKKVEELSNGKGEGPTAKTSRSKRVQQAKEDA